MASVGLMEITDVLEITVKSIDKPQDAYLFLQINMLKGG